MCRCTRTGRSCGCTRGRRGARRRSPGSGVVKVASPAEQAKNVRDALPGEVRPVTMAIRRQTTRASVALRRVDPGGPSGASAG